MSREHERSVRAFARRIPGLARLRTRLLLLVLLALLPVLGLVVYTAAQQRSAAIAEARASALRLVRMAAGGQKQHIEAARQLLSTLAQLSEIRQTNIAACDKLFASLLNVHRVYANIGMISPDGYLIASGVPMRRAFFGDRGFFQRSRSTMKLTVGDYRSGRVTHRPSVELGYPLRDAQGRFSGVIFAAFDLTWLNQLIARADLPDRSSITAIDRSGTVVLRYPDRRGRHPGDSVKDLPAIARILHGASEGTFTDAEFDGVNRIYAYTALSRSEAIADSWVLVGIPSESALAPAYRTLAINLSYLGFVMLLALTAAWYGGDFFILRKVRALVAATERVAAGDLRARTQTAYDAGELGHLARSFDEMANSLEKRVAERERA